MPQISDRQLAITLDNLGIGQDTIYRDQIRRLLDLGHSSASVLAWLCATPTTITR